MLGTRLGPVSPSTVSVSSQFDEHTDLRELVKGEEGRLSPLKSKAGMSPASDSDSLPEYRRGGGSNSRLGLRGAKRLITKRGKINVDYDPDVRFWCFRYMKDIFTTSVDLPWRYHVLLMCAFFLTSWVFFAGLYYGIVLIRGDLANINNDEWKPCFRNFYNWRSAFLYSIEAQTTIGFGFRSPTEECGEVTFLLVFQTIAAKFLEAFVIGTFVGKFTRPRSRGNTLMFSKRAVINMEDGKMVFRFRIGDIRRKSPIIEGHVTLFMIRHYITEEGSFYPYRILDMSVGYDVGLDRIFLFWPLLIKHVIDHDSPLFGVSRGDMALADFEIVAVFEGIVEATGTTTQVRTSFLPEEIEWGYDFDNIILETEGKIFVDFQRFHDTRPIVGFTPNSAKFLKEQGEMIENTCMRGPVWQERLPDIEKISYNRNSHRANRIESRL